MWWLALIAFLILGPLSRIAGLTRWVGDRIPIDRFYLWMFDRIVGRETARDIREDHVTKVIEYLREEDADIDETSEELARDIERMKDRTAGRFSRGESVLGLLLAVAGVVAPWWIALILAVLLAVSISVRLTTIEAVAYTNPDPKEDSERLFAKRVWNNSVLAESQVAKNTLLAKVIKQWNEQFYYELWLDRTFIEGIRNPEIGDKSTISQLFWIWNKIGEDAVEMHVGEQNKETEETDVSSGDPRCPECDTELMEDTESRAVRDDKEIWKCPGCGFTQGRPEGFLQEEHEAVERVVECEERDRS